MNEIVKANLRFRGASKSQIPISISSEAMVHLTEAAHTTSASIQEFNKATVDLHETVRGLREEVAKFKIN